MNRKFSEIFGNGFLISQEMIKNHGEDNFYYKYSDDSAVICVLDGCGGLGSRTYDGCSGKTGAYIASRTVSGAIHDWYHDTCGIKWKSDKELVRSVLDYITKGYSFVSKYAKSNIKISGSMVRDLPTTMALAFICMQNDSLVVHVIWAGDSRIYILDENGLCQATRDDVKSQDALSNLSDDGALTNVLSSDEDYSLHHKAITLSKPAIVIGATDGCFGYLPTPMDFEYEILRALANSKSMIDFENILMGFFNEVAGDDFTFGCMAFGYECFEDLKISFDNRRIFMEREYIHKLASDPDNERLVLKLWQKYRINYERYLKKLKGAKM